jgi:hypothetical protein
MGEVKEFVVFGKCLCQVRTLRNVTSNIHLSIKCLHDLFRSKKLLGLAVPCEMLLQEFRALMPVPANKLLKGVKNENVNIT